MMTVLRKSTVRPCPSVQDLQQRVEDVRVRLSTSSNSTTENGLRRTASVSGLAALRGGDHGVGGAEIDTDCNCSHYLLPGGGPCVAACPRRVAPRAGSTRKPSRQPVISILRGLAASDFGMVSVSTPSVSSPRTASALTSPGR